ncbi:MAG: DUF3854 domain-containing protein, partial [Xenococcaceae cyanobacterium]
MIIDSHRHEWVKGSEIDPYLTSLNLISLNGYSPHEYLLYALGQSERRNDGRLRDKWMYRYAHLENGGWWCSGVNILTGEDSVWGCFKPNTPRIKVEYNSQGHFKKTKTIKYEHP